MPKISFIDIDFTGPKEGPFAIPDEVVTHEVTGREGALDVLRADLQRTADPHWAGQIVIRFLQGENDITMPNGNGHSFRVLYQE